MSSAPGVAPGASAPPPASGGGGGLALPANIYPGAALIATGLAFQGLKSGSLSTDGAVAAWAVGYTHLANPIKLFGVSMIVFYLLGSKATKVNKQNELVLICSTRPL